MNYANTVRNAHWEGGRIVKMTDPSNGSFSITMDTGWSIGVDAKHHDRLHVGDLFEMAGGIGFPIQGQRVNGYVLWFKDAAEMEADRLKWLADHEAKKRAEYEAHKDEWRGEVEALPPLLRARMDRFITEAGGFEPFFTDCGAYELFCCTEAVKFAAYFAPLLARKSDAEAQAEVDAFRALSYEEQRKLVPFSDGHSGNTFGGALALGASVAIGREV